MKLTRPAFEEIFERVEQALWYWGDEKLIRDFHKIAKSCPPECKCTDNVSCPNVCLKGDEKNG